MRAFPTTDPRANGPAALMFGPFTLVPAERRLEAGGKPLRLGSRTMDLLLCFAARAGEVVSRRDLTAHVWAGTHVEDSNLRFQIGQLRRALAEHSPGREYIANVAGRGYCFTATVQRQDRAREAHPNDSHPNHRLPRPSAPLIGRDHDIDAITARINTTRLLTVVGPGGVGKTATAMATAHRWAAETACMTVFVDLSPLTTSGGVAHAVASALDITATTTDPAPQVTEALSGRDMLLILDNCEHVAEDAAHLVERLISASPDLRVLATSREPLRGMEEAIYWLAPLDGPMVGDGRDATAMRALPAVDLFISRARRQLQDFDPDDHATRIVADLCRRLDGLPLAIELVAGRVGSLGLAGLSTLLASAPLTMEGARRAAPGRQRTLRASLDWSYALLPPAEAAMFRALSIFSGPFTLDAALWVMDDGSMPWTDLMVLLSSLVERSMVAVNIDAHRTRYRFLETTRFYAREKLLGSGQMPAVARRHAMLQVETPERTLAMAATALKRDDLSAPDGPLGAPPAFPPSGRGWSGGGGKPPGDRTGRSVPWRKTDSMGRPFRA
ncbi:winged helix-turn-helix domain-containing protein [Nitrospirillum sp. BR 11164]|uniref:ATP-binding protein n=1 Tax=Nitrospirillum sp. BR 11164 TaxID=3104324 RepID=UPI002AFF7AC3|nr:winged helix-turn-helix domain-containing protein [Nitrospirillum sp. BR 11164]MEA1648031.1 winged helix-turn-helix domain-containing protein [Nitrospirillum sp. BR 11164]